MRILRGRFTILRSLRFCSLPPQQKVKRGKLALHLRPDEVISLAAAALVGAGSGSIPLGRADMERRKCTAASAAAIGVMLLLSTGVWWLTALERDRREFWEQDDQEEVEELAGL